MTIDSKRFPLKRLALVIAFIWAIFILVSAFWNANRHEKEVKGVIRQMVRSSMERDRLYSLWNSMHGGIYAPVTEKTRPNSYLVPEMSTRRDLVVSRDLSLTLINPAYMSRQVYELAREKNIVSGYIVSRNPLNPRSKADGWEEKALAAVVQGDKEFSETIRLGGQEYLRMLLPLLTEESCLPCHGVHGYREGDLLGGISVSLPMASFYDPDGREHRLVFTGHFIILLIGLAGIYYGYAALAQGEAARRKAEEQIVNLAYFDRLTGLVNRNLFQDRLAHALAMARREKKKVALLYIDLDRFKPVNDLFGHEAGDRVLQEVADRLAALARASDTVARIGGDEFVVLLPDIHDKQDSAPLAQKILSAIERPFAVKGNEHSVGASIGISCFPDDGEDMDALMKNADAAMYLVKSRAGGGFEFFSPQSERP